MPNLYFATILAPLFGAAITGLFCRCIPRRVAHTLAISGVLVAFILSIIALKYHLVDGHAAYNGTLYQWMTVGSLRLEVGFLVDSLTTIMMCVVTFVSLMVHIYTIGYMHDDPGYNRFFSYLSLFTFSMLTLVMANNFMQLFFGWEAVGLVSYLLIGFWFKRPTAIYANMKAFLVNRVGDFGFLLGIACVLKTFGSLDYAEVFAQAPQAAQATINVLGGWQWPMITVMCILLFVGAMGKSAQVPLHGWLPDSMEGPTPISALIHAATMVTAGIFMVARMSPLYELSAGALWFITTIGAITALFLGLLGIIQNDIKRVIAYSTLSQLGYMTVALGVSAYPVAIYHLMTHAFFKALLFLGAGSVIIAMHHEQDIRYMGGLRKYMPITAFTSLIGTLSLVGTPLFSGFYSKDSIIEAAWESGHYIAWFAVVIGVFITSVYSFRLYFVVFHGKERFKVVHAVHGEDHHAHHVPGELAHMPQETPWVVTLPLILLAIPSVIIGGMSIGMLYDNTFAGAIHIAQEHMAMAKMKAHFHGIWAMAAHSLITLPVFLTLLGAVLTWLIYLAPQIYRDKVNTKLQPALHWWGNVRQGLKASAGLDLDRLYQWFFGWMQRKYGIDEAYQGIADKAIQSGVNLWQKVDINIIDDGMVHGMVRLVQERAQDLRGLQSKLGYLYHSSFALALGLLGLLTYALAFLD